MRRLTIGGAICGGRTGTFVLFSVLVIFVGFQTCSSGPRPTARLLVRQTKGQAGWDRLMPEWLNLNPELWGNQKEKNKKTSWNWLPPSRSRIGPDVTRGITLPRSHYRPSGVKHLNVVFKEWPAGAAGRMSALILYLHFLFCFDQSIVPVILDLSILQRMCRLNIWTFITSRGQCR